MHRSIFLHIISILAFLPFIQCINLDPDNVIIAINCGAKKKFVTKDNVVFKPVFSLHIFYNILDDLNRIKIMQQLEAALVTLAFSYPRIGTQ